MYEADKQKKNTVYARYGVREYWRRPLSRDSDRGEAAGGMRQHSWSAGVFASYVRGA